MTEYSDDSEFSRPVAVADLRRHPGHVREQASPKERAALARRFGLPAIRALAFEAEIHQWRSRGWRVEGMVTGLAERDCVVTGETILEEVKIPMRAGFLPAALLPETELDGAELEIAIDPEIGEAPEILGDYIDLGELAAEVFALALEPFPRKEGVAYVEAAGGPPGEEPLTDETTKPLAGLAALKAHLEK